MSRQNSTMSEKSSLDSVTVKAADLGLTVSSVGNRDEKKSNARKVSPISSINMFWNIKYKNWLL